MTVLYSDASALLRVLFDETGPRLPIAAGCTIVASQIVEVETYRAVDRLRITGSLDDHGAARYYKELHALLAKTSLIAVSSDVIALARANFPVNIRALDAIHVATAQWASTTMGPLQFWTHDDRQALAATSRALDVRGI